MLHDWPKKTDSRHFLILSKVKPKPIVTRSYLYSYFVRSYFPRFASATCNYFFFVLIDSLFCPCPLRLTRMITLVFVLCQGFTPLKLSFKSCFSCRQYTSSFLLFCHVSERPSPMSHRGVSLLQGTSYSANKVPRLAG